MDKDSQKILIEIKESLGFLTARVQDIGDDLQRGLIKIDEKVDKSDCKCDNHDLKNDLKEIEKEIVLNSDYRKSEIVKTKITAGTVSFITSIVVFVTGLMLQMFFGV